MKSNKVRLLLTIGSCVGVVGTGVASAVGGSKARDKMYDDPSLWEADKKTKTKALWKCYIGALIFGSATIGCNIANHKVNGKVIAGAVGMAASAQQLYKRYEDKLKEVLPEEKLKEVKREVMKDRAKMAKKPKRKHEPDDEFFYEPVSDQYFYGKREDILKAQNELNKILIYEPTEEVEEADHYAVGVHINNWLELLRKHVDENITNMGYYDDLNFGWYYGDGDWYWDYNWSFFGGPWVSVDFVEITEGNDKYTMLDYGAMAPYFGSSGNEDLCYSEEIKDAKMRWENEYA